MAGIFLGVLRLNAAVHMTAVTSDSLNPFGSMHASQADPKTVLACPAEEGYKRKAAGLAIESGVLLCFDSHPVPLQYALLCRNQIPQQTKVSKFSFIREHLTSKDSSYDTLC